MAILLLCLLFSGCACLSGGAPKGAGEGISSGVAPGEAAWWAARFRFAWPEGEIPSWHYDLMVAHAVVAPVLDANAADITLWRFHRRAARDGAGHQFSFIFYARPHTAARVFDALGSSPVLEKIKDAGWVVSNTYDDLTGKTRSNVEDTSDAAWSEPVRKAWPYFIMGVSRLWLELINETAEPVPVGCSPGVLAERYRKAEVRVTGIWAEEGRHAFLHHLNALFGYAPLIIYEKREVSF